LALFYKSGDEIRQGDRVLLHGLPGEVEFVADTNSAPDHWPLDKFGSGIMIIEPVAFGRLFLNEADLSDYEDLEVVARLRSPAA